MEQRSNDVAEKDVQTKPSEEEYARRTVHIVVHKMSLLQED